MVWRILLERVYRTQIKVVEELWQHVEEEWDGLDHTLGPTATLGPVTRLEIIISK